MKSGFTSSLSDEMVSASVAHMEEAPGDCSFSWWACGRAIARAPEDAIAFSGREGAFWSSAEALWEEPAQDQAHVGWGRDGMAAIEPYTRVGPVLNDVAETGRDVVRSGVRGREARSSRRPQAAWDPDSVF
jgi:hypothetical protein